MNVNKNLKFRMMKNLILSIAFVFGGVMAANAQATMDFEKTVHDYGTIQQNDNGTCDRAKLRLSRLAMTPSGWV